MGYSSVVCAGTISGVLGGGVWTGWTQFQDNPIRSDGKVSEDWVGGSGFVDPGWGGQKFDAEYFFYKLDGDTLSLGLQTGFDIVEGKVTSGGKDYFTGDIALSFDGQGITGTGGSTANNTPTDNSFEYAVDFGLASKDYSGNDVSAGAGDTDTAGLYTVSSWNNDVILTASNDFTESNPFAMDGGTVMNGVSFTNTFGSGDTPIGSDGSAKSYFRKVSFDIGQFRQSDGSLWVDAHWTMSCGNDAINGTIHEPMPEPGTIALLGIGLAGLVGVGARRKWKMKAVENS